MDFAGEGVLGIGAGRGRAVVRFAPFHFQRPHPVPVVNRESLGGGSQRFFDNKTRNFDNIALDSRPGILQELSCALMQNLTAYFFQDFKSGLFDLPDLVIAQHTERY